MFGLFREKTIVEDLCIKNVSNSIVELWTDETNLNYEKFNSFAQFSSVFSRDEMAESRLLIKKLELVTSVAVTLLSKEDASHLLRPISEKVIRLIEEILGQKVSLTPEDLVERAEKLSKLRFSTNPREAGQLIENDLSNFVFKFTLDSGDVDGRYFLYKQLSSLERTAIFKIGSAIRHSQK